MIDPIDSMYRRQAMAQDIKDTMRLADSWPDLRPDVKETLENLQSTVSAILNGANGSRPWLDLAQMCINIAESMVD